MTAYYNEIDPQAAQWLRNLIAAGHIAPGDVDERSVWDVHPDDLAPYIQCHFFAGIGVWSYALRRAGWPDDRPVWTGSCPCQPFSQAGKGRGVADDRHLWPAFRHLIGERRPGVVFGEQVEGKDGRAWLDVVQADLERGGYAVGAVVVPAAGVGAPHIRHRCYFVADSERRPAKRRGHDVAGAARGAQGEARKRQRLRDDARTGSDARVLEHSDNADGRQSGHGELQPRGEHGLEPQDGSPADGDQWTGPVNGFWGIADWITCTDEKWRPIEPGTFPLVDGAPARLAGLRAYGNAIVAPVAQEFIAAYLSLQRGGR